MASKVKGKLVSEKSGVPVIKRVYSFNTCFLINVSSPIHNARMFIILKAFLIWLKNHHSEKMSYVIWWSETGCFWCNGLLQLLSANATHTSMHALCMQESHVCVRKRRCADGKVSEDDGVAMLWYLRSLCKSHHERQWALTLMPFHTTHHLHTLTIPQPLWCAVLFLSTHSTLDQTTQCHGIISQGKPHVTDHMRKV